MTMPGSPSRTMRLIIAVDSINAGPGCGLSANCQRPMALMPLFTTVRFGRFGSMIATQWDRCRAGRVRFVMRSPVGVDPQELQEGPQSPFRHFLQFLQG
jgi:hypothetical protein